MAALTNKHPTATLQLLAYMPTIIKASQQYDSILWRSYDTHHSLEGDAYKLQKQSLKQLEDGTCPQMQAEQTEEGLDSVKECVEEVQETLDGFVHPCEGVGWKEVVNVTYSHPGVECPPAWQDNEYDIKGCGRKKPDFNTIDSQSFPVSGVEYDEVCGRIHGYGVGLIAAFDAGSDDVTIEEIYVEGISLTHTAADNTLVHIWTFAASQFENPDSVDSGECPCDGGANPPDFVGQNYFCESGATDPGGTTGFHGDDLLWDGKDCAVEVCCTRAGPPYFHSYLPQPTTADIDARLMLVFSDIDVSITHIELYVRRIDH